MANCFFSTAVSTSGAKHQMVHIVAGDDDALRASKPVPGANLVKALDFAGYSAHGHDLAGMAHRAGKGQIQAHRHVGQGRKQGHQFRSRGRIAFKPA